tara:strand:+ start:1742 stop:2263 length:522 start_codon:yes stop_codon:yes gene_type:complete
MTISELGSVGELIGAIATVATLMYLALQIRANTLSAKYSAINDIINRVIKWQSRIADTPDLMSSWKEGTQNYHGLNIEKQVRFTSIAVEMLAAIEATLEAAKNDGIKPESVDAVRAMVHQLMRNKGVREYWVASGRNLFAQDFVDEVDIILKDATNERSEEPGPLPFYMPPAH